MDSVTLLNGKEPPKVTDARVIVIEPSDSEGRALQTLLRFLDLEPLLAHDLDELRRFSHGESRSEERRVGKECQ